MGYVENTLIPELIKVVYLNILNTCFFNAVSTYCRPRIKNLHYPFMALAFDGLGTRLKVNHDITETEFFVNVSSPE